MIVQPHITRRVAAAAVVAAVLLVFFSGNDEAADPTAPLRALARACELSERMQRRLHVLEQAHTLRSTVSSGHTFVSSSRSS
jgi:hypothetical protein